MNIPTSDNKWFLMFYFYLGCICYCCLSCCRMCFPLFFRFCSTEHLEHWESIWGFYLLFFSQMARSFLALALWCVSLYTSISSAVPIFQYVIWWCCLCCRHYYFHCRLFLSSDAHIDEFVCSFVRYFLSFSSFYFVSCLCIFKLR